MLEWSWFIVLSAAITIWWGVTDTDDEMRMYRNAIVAIVASIVMVFLTGNKTYFALFFWLVKNLPETGDLINGFTALVICLVLFAAQFFAAFLVGIGTRRILGCGGIKATKT